MSPPLPNTAVILVNPYNDFIHADGKAYGLVSESLVSTNTVANLQELLKAARALSVPIYYALHQQYKDGFYDGWKRMNATTTGIKNVKLLEESSWGAEIFAGLEPDVLGNGDVVVSKHWNSSGFANTDLDYQLHQRDITHVVIAGMIANTCVESTARYARELGYHTTLLKDATAGFSTAVKDAATELIWPLIADDVSTVYEWIKSLESESV